MFHGYSIARPASMCLFGSRYSPPVGRPFRLRKKSQESGKRKGNKQARTRERVCVFCAARSYYIHWSLSSPASFSASLPDAPQFAPRPLPSRPVLFLYRAVVTSRVKTQRAVCSLRRNIRDPPSKRPRQSSTLGNSNNTGIISRQACFSSL